jgi:hypothetical protein
MPEAHPCERMHCRHARVSACDDGPARAQLTRVLLGVDLLAASNGTQLVSELRRHGAGPSAESAHDASHHTRDLALLPDRQTLLGLHSLGQFARTARTMCGPCNLTLWRTLYLIPLLAAAAASSGLSAGRCLCPGGMGALAPTHPTKSCRRRIADHGRRMQACCRQPARAWSPSTACRWAMARPLRPAAGRGPRLPSRSRWRPRPRPPPRRPWSPPSRRSLPRTATATGSSGLCLLGVRPPPSAARPAARLRGRRHDALQPALLGCLERATVALVLQAFAHSDLCSKLSAK